MNLKSRRPRTYCPEELLTSRFKKELALTSLTYNDQNIRSNPLLSDYPIGRSSNDQFGYHSDEAARKEKKK